MQRAPDAREVQKAEQKFRKFQVTGAVPVSGSDKRKEVDMPFSRRNLFKRAGLIVVATALPVSGKPIDALAEHLTAWERAQQRKYWQLDQTMTQPRGFSVADMKIVVTIDTGPFEDSLIRAEQKAKHLFAPFQFEMSYNYPEYNMSPYIINRSRFYKIHRPEYFVDEVYKPFVSIEADGVSFVGHETDIATRPDDPGYLYIKLNGQVEHVSVDTILNGVLTMEPDCVIVGDRGEFVFRVPYSTREGIYPHRYSQQPPNMWRP